MQVSIMRAGPRQPWARYVHLMRRYDVIRRYDAAPDCAAKILRTDSIVSASSTRLSSR